MVLLRRITGGCEEMTVAEQIIQHIKALPETVQSEVLDFVEYLESKKNIEETDWSTLSISQAMRGMESEDSPYSTDDLKDMFA